MAHFSKFTLKPLGQSNGNNAFVSSAPTESNERADTEDQIAGLLGDHMPLVDNNAANSEGAVLLPHFMSLRLLLLRPLGRRSNDENELLEIVKKSFQGYSKDNKRTGSELARLLVKDWMYLSTSLPTSKPPAQGGLHRCHVMEAPSSIQTSSATGVPTTMPSVLAGSSPVGGVVPLQKSMGGTDATRLVHRQHSLTKPTADHALQNGIDQVARELTEEQRVHRANIVPES